MTSVRIELLPGDRMGLTFAYDAHKVGLLRILSRRKWNAGQKRWEVHLAHLPEVMRIFGLEETDFPAPVLEKYRSEWSDGGVRVTLGRLHGTISGVGLPSVELDEVTSFPVPGHQFSPLFKSGRWDGRKHLLSRETLRFPAGLWPRIREVLDRNEVRYEVRESDPPRAGEAGGPPPGFSPARSELRDYQLEALRGAAEAGKGILQIATGGGKTLLAAHLIRELNCGAFFFVHTRDLLHQTIGVLGRELGVEIGCLGDGRADLRPVTVATIQTAARVFGISIPRGPKGEGESGPKEKATRLGDRKQEIAEAVAATPAVIFDECHHVPADTFYKVAFRAKSAVWRFGLSATPWRDDGHDLLLEAALGPRICEVRASDLIARGYLVAPEIEMVRVPGAAGRGGSRRTPYPEVYRRSIVENRSRNRMIATRAAEWADAGLSVLVLVGQVEHGRLLNELLPQAVFAYGDLDSETRRAHIEGLERKLHKIMIATTLADEGLDIPGLDAIILAGGGKSETRAYQRIGRTLRPSPGKTKARVLDFLDPGPWLSEHSLARLRLYQEEPAFEVRTEGFA